MGLFKRGESKKNVQSAVTNLYHVSGLPLPEKTLCKIELNSPQLFITGNGSSFSIEASQIKGAQFKTEKNPAPNGGISVSSYLLISFLDNSSELKSLTFKIDIAEAKTKDIKEAQLIAEVLGKHALSSSAAIQL